MLYPFLNSYQVILKKKIKYMMKIYNDNKCDDYVHESKWYNFCTNFCRNMLTHC